MQQGIKIFIIPYFYEAQHVSGDTPPIISWWTLSEQVCLTTSTNYTSNNLPHINKPEAVSAVLGF